jgi:hypothetical protein
MKTIVFLIVAGMVLVSSLASAQTATATATLSATATVSGSISCVLNSDPGGVPLGGSGTNAATLNFGSISASGPLSAGVTRPSVTATAFTVRTLADVFTTKANTGSANYTLKAQLATADPTNVWLVNGVAITNAASATILATGSYAVNIALTVDLTVPTSTPSGTNISNIINFTCTAN